ncbi:MAG: hypothetical protein ACKVQC_07640, partial [Elusimicrobiota bacterium]
IANALLVDNNYGILIALAISQVLGILEHLKINWILKDSVPASHTRTSTSFTPIITFTPEQKLKWLSLETNQSGLDLIPEFKVLDNKKSKYLSSIIGDLFRNAYDASDKGNETEKLNDAQVVFGINEKGDGVFRISNPQRINREKIKDSLPAIRDNLLKIRKLIRSNSIDPEILSPFQVLPLLNLPHKKPAEYLRESLGIVLLLLTKTDDLTDEDVDSLFFAAFTTTKISEQKNTYFKEMAQEDALGGTGFGLFLAKQIAPYLGAQIKTRYLPNETIFEFIIPKELFQINSVQTKTKPNIDKTEFIKRLRFNGMQLPDEILETIIKIENYSVESVTAAFSKHRKRISLLLTFKIADIAYSLQNSLFPLFTHKKEPVKKSRATAKNLSDQDVNALAEEINKKLGGPNLIRLPDIEIEGQKIQVETSKPIPNKINTLYRVGPLIVVLIPTLETGIYNIKEKKNELIEKLGELYENNRGNILFCCAPPYQKAMFEVGHYLSPHAFVPLAHLIVHREKIKDVTIGFGSADALLEQAAYVLGKGKITLVEKETGSLMAGYANMFDLIENESDVILVNEDILNIELNDPMFYGVKTVIANIGSPNVYLGVNDKVVQIVKNIAGLELFINSGWLFNDPAAISSLNQTVNVLGGKRYDYILPLTFRGGNSDFKMSVIVYENSQTRNYHPVQWETEKIALIEKENPGITEKIKKILSSYPHNLQEGIDFEIREEGISERVYLIKLNKPILMDGRLLTHIKIKGATLPRGGSKKLFDPKKFLLEKGFLKNEGTNRFGRYVTNKDGIISYADRLDVPHLGITFDKAQREFIGNNNIPFDFSSPISLGLASFSDPNDLMANGLPAGAVIEAIPAVISGGDMLSMMTTLFQDGIREGNPDPQYISDSNRFYAGAGNNLAELASQKVLHEQLHINNWGIQETDEKVFISDNESTILNNELTPLQYFAQLFIALRNMSGSAVRGYNTDFFQKFKYNPVPHITRGFLGSDSFPNLTSDDLDDTIKQSQQMPLFLSNNPLINAMRLRFPALTQACEEQLKNIKADWQGKYKGETKKTTTPNASHTGYWVLDSFTEQIFPALATLIGGSIFYYLNGSGMFGGNISPHLTLFDYFLGFSMSMLFFTFVFFRIFDWLHNKQFENVKDKLAQIYPNEKITRDLYSYHLFKLSAYFVVPTFISFFLIVYFFNDFRLAFEVSQRIGISAHLILNYFNRRKILASHSGRNKIKRNHKKLPSLPFMTGSIYDPKFIKKERAVSATNPTVVFDLNNTLGFMQDGQWKTRPGVLEELKKLKKKNYRLILWTYSNQKLVEDVQQQDSRFMEYFDQIITFENYRPESNEPDIFDPFIEKVRNAYAEYIDPSRETTFDPHYIITINKGKDISLLGYHVIVDDQDLATTSNWSPTGSIKHIHVSGVNQITTPTTIVDREILELTTTIEAQINERSANQELIELFMGNTKSLNISDIDGVRFNKAETPLALKKINEFKKDKVILVDQSMLDWLIPQWGLISAQNQTSQNKIILIPSTKAIEEALISNIPKDPNNEGIEIISFKKSKKLFETIKQNKLFTGINSDELIELLKFVRKQTKAQSALDVALFIPSTFRLILDKKGTDIEKLFHTLFIVIDSSQGLSILTTNIKVLKATEKAA